MTPAVSCLALLTSLNIGMITSDDWDCYAREIPNEKHLSGKILAQRIERNT
ncbi:IS1 transposase domain protein [Escherichia coli 9.1649]|nr:IS1 transposase domain protein [Escherichia coli 9.1649]